MTVSASPHCRSIPLWQVKPPQSIAHMVHITVGKASKKALSQSGSQRWQTCSDSTYAEMQKALHGLFDTGWFIGPRHSCKCLRRGHEEAPSASIFVSCLIVVIKCHILLSLRLTKNWGEEGADKMTGLWIFSAFKLTMPSGGNKDFNWTSLSILVVHRFHAPIREGWGRYRQRKKKTQQTKLSEICPACISSAAKVLCITKRGWPGSLSCEV